MSKQTHINWNESNIIDDVTFQEEDAKQFMNLLNSKEEAAQTARVVSNALKAGHPEGNTNKGAVRGEPSVRLEGRSTMGSLPKPAYTVNKEGVVVVKIMVDQYGKVTNAIPGQSGTTVSDPTLWAAAKSAALKARFNVSASAAAVQTGTITYIFKLK